MTEADEQLERYATISAALAAGQPRQAVLTAHGVSEEAFDALEAEIEAKFSAAMDASGAEVPRFLQEYEAAMRRAQQEVVRAGPAVSLESFARGVAVVQGTSDPVKALERAGLTTADLVRGLTDWGEALAKDPELAAKFESAKLGKKRQ